MADVSRPAGFVYHDLTMAAGEPRNVTTEPVSRFISINGIRLHYADWSGAENGRTIVLLHGGAAHSHWWDGVAPALRPLGRVIALDFRGHGRSSWAQPPVYGPRAYVDDVRALLATFQRPIVLIGHSMGGEVAQWVAVEDPKLIDALVIVDAPAGAPPLWRRLMWQWRRRARGGTRPELPSAEDVVRRFRLLPPGSYLTAEALRRLALQGAEQLPNGKWAYRFDPETRAWRRRAKGMRRPNLRAISAATLILRGAESTLVSARKARSMSRRIRGSVLCEIPRAYHHVPLDNPAATAAAIMDFLRALPGRG
jgi:pimeloyl-ACP methyl ester carboxylesterase